MIANFTLSGEQIRLEPLGQEHIVGLLRAGAADRGLYQWSPVPNGLEEVTSYVNTARSWRDAGSAVPFAIVRKTDDTIIGSTRYWNIEHWSWPRSHANYGRGLVDACEIGYTWLASSAIRTGVNTEAKYLMLEHAFEQWNALRVCFHTDRRNQRSQAALERIGALFEGVLRAHRMAADFVPRDSFRYSILAEEWPSTKERFRQLLTMRQSPK